MNRITQLKIYILYPLTFLVFSAWIGLLLAVDIDSNQAGVWTVGLLPVVTLVTLLGIRAVPSSIGEGVKIGIT